MGRKYLLLTITAAVIALSCSRNAITGRSQLSLVSEAQLQQMAALQYKQFLTQNSIASSGSRDAEMVKRVGSRVANAIAQYYKQQGAGNELEGYQWEFNLVNNKEVNAWCMPGGKVVVYSGLLPVAQNEAALAIVMGHEITHAVAGHGRERMSQQLAAQGIGTLGNVALGGSGAAANVFSAVFAPGAQVGILLPNSRKQELEADHYGLIFAAMAGYDPREAIPFWQRMMSLNQSGATATFLSDHPADQQRIQELQNFMPDALKYYKPAR